MAFNKGKTCSMEEEVWNALHSTFNSVKDRPFDMDHFCESITPHVDYEWLQFSMAEMKEAPAPCSNGLAPGVIFKGRPYPQDFDKGI